MHFAIDFDGTIVDDIFPEIGQEKKEMTDFMKELKKAGHKIIIWTCRQGETLNAAIQFMKDKDIPFDYVNENPDNEKIYGGAGRKVFADFYVDDRNLSPKDIKDFGLYLAHLSIPVFKNGVS